MFLLLARMPDSLSFRTATDGSENAATLAHGPKEAIVLYFVSKVLRMFVHGTCPKGSLTVVGVRAWLARGYFIPGGASQRVG